MSGEYPPAIIEALAVCDAVRVAGGEVRLFGGVAAAIVGRPWFDSHPAFARRTRDIDLVGRKEHLKIVRDVLVDRGFREAPQVRVQTEGERAYFSRSDITIDFAGDELIFCQRLDVRDRLHLAYPTLPVTDLLLEKLQIVEPAEHNLADLLALIGSVGPATIDNAYVWRVLGARWGYWYSAKRFIERAKEFARRNAEESSIVTLNTLGQIIGSTPRTLRWRVRAAFGTTLPWYAPVEPLQVEVR